MKTNNPFPHLEALEFFLQFNIDIRISFGLLWSMPAWNQIDISREELENLYLNQKLSIAKIARKFDTSTSPVQRSLREFKIPIRNLAEACTKVPVTKKQLKYWYFKEKRSMFDIAGRLGCTHSAIVYKFQKLGIKSRGHLGLTKSIKLKKKSLEYLYYERGLSLKKIAKIVHCSESGLERKFKVYNLKSRGIKNRACKYKKFDFSEDPIEKAYLIGFRLGDLNIIKTVNVIQARCSTTISNQLKLIRQLFSPYTTVRATKGKRGDWDIVASVNKSFDFLIPKHKNIPRWIPENPNTFFAFLAGYIDAEGYFYFKKPKRNGKISTATFGIQTQDKGIICKLAKKLNDFSIQVYGPMISEPAGHIDKRGVRNNKDVWCFNVIQKQSLWKLIHHLEPYLKHADKIRRLKEVKENLILRNEAPYCRPIDLSTSFLSG